VPNPNPTPLDEPSKEGGDPPGVPLTLSGLLYKARNPKTEGRKKSEIRNLN